MKNKINIIFESISERSYPLVKILTFLNLEIFYLDLICNEFNKEKLFGKLKKNKVIPLPLNDQQNIPYEVFYESSFDKNEILFKKNKILISEKILDKFCKVFLIDKLKNIDLRLVLQDHLFAKTSDISTKIKIWSELNKDKKIVFVSFNFWTLYFIDKISNVKKILIPLNFIEKIFIMFFKKISNKKNFNKKLYSNDLFNKKVALVVHKGISASNNLYEKKLYYSEKKDSPFNKKNIIHLDYDNFDKPSDEFLWLNLKKISISKTNFLFKLLKGSTKTFSCITSWKNFLAWFLLMYQYSSYIIYLEKLEKFKELKLALIDYDHLCPKGLIFAFKKKKIKIVATQERFVGGLFKSFYNVIADTYFTCSDYMNETIKNSKYFQVENSISVGQYRADYLSAYYKKDIPKEISIQKKMGKKIIVALGIGLDKFPHFDSNFDMTINWKSQKNFIDDMLKLSNDIENVHLIFRFRTFGWKDIPYFQSSLTKINKAPNVSIAENYSEFFHSYRYCANADLIISKRTSLADECLAFGKPLIFYDYTHNLKKIISNLPGYIPARSKEMNNSDIFCQDYNEILEKTRLMLSENSDQIKIQKNNINQIYSLKDKGKVKEKILNYLEHNL